MHRRVGLNELCSLMEMHWWQPGTPVGLWRTHSMKEEKVRLSSRKRKLWLIVSAYNGFSWRSKVLDQYPYFEQGKALRFCWARPGQGFSTQWICHWGPWRGCVYLNRTKSVKTSLSLHISHIFPKLQMKHFNHNSVPPLSFLEHGLRVPQRPTWLWTWAG